MRMVVVGAGHNGLVCACYLARAGVGVLVVEQARRPGGGSRTDETVPGYRFDTHSVAHNIINMTAIPRELDLAGAGLVYREMDPFAVAIRGDGRIVRFHRSVEQTVASIAEHDPAEADAYSEFMDLALPLVDIAVATLQGGGRRQVGELLRRAPAALGVLRRQGAALVPDLLAPYGPMLERRLMSDLTRGPVAAFAAHAGAAPDSPGSALFALWQAAYHRHGQWHAVGGAQALADALVRRLEGLGGQARCGAAVRSIDSAGGRARAVVLEDGERLAADAVVAAIDPRVALLELSDPPPQGRAATALRAAHSANTVQALVHVATDRLPPYRNARPGDWNGLQSYVDDLGALSTSFAAAADRRLHRPAAAYAFSTSALDDSLAPPGHHTVYLACPAAPFEVEGGWTDAGERLVDDLLDQVEARAPGFRNSIQGLSVRTPQTMADELRWPGAHPMYLDVSLDQLGPLRPTPSLASHRTPIAGLYLSGAGTAPVGGIAGAPGRAAARALLKDHTPAAA